MFSLKSEGAQAIGWERKAVRINERSWWAFLFVQEVSVFRRKMPE